MCVLCFFTGVPVFSCVFIQAKAGNAEWLRGFAVDIPPLQTAGFTSQTTQKQQIF